MQIHRTKVCKVHESPGHEPIWSTKSKEKRQWSSSLSTPACVMHDASSTISHYKTCGPLNFSPDSGFGGPNNTPSPSHAGVGASTRIDNFLHYYLNHQFIYRLGCCRHWGSSACVLTMHDCGGLNLNFGCDNPTWPNVKLELGLFGYKLCAC